MCRPVVYTYPMQNHAMARSVDIGGRRLSLEGRGHGRPAVLLEQGMNETQMSWGTIPAAVAPYTTVYSYDRAGRGDSDPAPVPRTALDLVVDLHALLSAAAIPPPYVLVGQSFGGLIVRVYASRYPDAVAGLVLVDPTHEATRSLLAHLPADQQAELEALLWPPNAEGIDRVASEAQLRAAPPLRPMPLQVLTRTPGRTPPPDWLSAELAGALEAGVLRLHGELARSVPGGQHRVAQRSGHYIQRDEPKVVLDAIRDVVQSVGK